MRLRLTDMAYGGDAVGRDPESGMAIFAWPGITGEEVDVEVHSRREKLARGLVTTVVEPSDARVAPPCPYFGECGGCQWQHITYEAQVPYKNNILVDQLARHGGVAGVDLIMKPPVPSPSDYGYRNTSHFAVDPQSHKLAYSRRGSHS
ncbi:MAG: 23S rRNA (uracil(1939)-C(5))-methyltransferase RlmD, partial [Chloroflexota bacterium]|nr:23S rRNA (uracil(1939)-C(5))-methyltransferase RlmD [Chloroflexota bacterium]